MMAIRLLKLTFLLTLVFAALVGLIRAQPYDDSELRAFLTPPEGCPMPCFMGIRPGVTTAEEAVRILEAHEWVDFVNILVQNDGQTIFAISAAWNGLQPDWLKDSERLFIRVSDNRIQYMIVYTHIRLGDIWLSFGSPEKMLLIERIQIGSSFQTIYTDRIFGFSIRETCRLEAMWYSQTSLTVNHNPLLTNAFEGENLPTQTLRICRGLQAAN